MKFPNAAKGVKKIFNAEIISLIAALIGGAGLVLGLIGASKETGESAGTITLTVSGVLLIVSGIAILVAGVINIIGFIQAAKDEEGIKRAVLCTLFSALFAFVAAFFENQTGFLGGLGSVDCHCVEYACCALHDRRSDESVREVQQTRYGQERS